ncbi:MAG: hypothetical protein K1060chlam2_01428 [Chlamydiae bacterium]|nr:hypothetical protein [Chlamydiota bacterium]
MISREKYAKIQIMKRFIGRENNLEELKDLLKKKSSSLVVINGRRRIGKSRLAEEFAKSFDSSYFFSGPPPTTQITAQEQRDEFARQLYSYKISLVNSKDWGDLFKYLADFCGRKKTLIVLDEITWMGAQDHLFLSKLKIAWDLYFKKNPKLILILSGSNSAWIEKNILNSTGFFGRISLRIHLEELPLYECQEFWNAKNRLISPYEKFKLLSVIGGIPRYLEEIQPEKSAEDNIIRMCFRKSGLLFNEFNEIFSDIFTSKTELYKKIVELLADKKATLQEIIKHLKRKSGGDISVLVDDLCKSDFVYREYAWKIKNGKESKISTFRLKDNYLRFYLKYIEPNRKKIESGGRISILPNWSTILGFQFENLVLNNLPTLYRLLKISPYDVVCAGPYLQTQTEKRKKCQIDLLIQTRHHNLYICEIKFKGEEINTSILQEVEEKINRLERPKGFSVRAALIHVNGVSNSVLEMDYFSEVVNFEELLTPRDSKDFSS